MHIKKPWSKLGELSEANAEECFPLPQRGPRLQAERQGLQAERQGLQAERQGLQAERQGRRAERQDHQVDHPE